MGSEKVLENFSRWSWKSPGFFSSERVGTLMSGTVWPNCADVPLRI